MATTTYPRSQALVLFGASGDLAKKKLLPSLYRLELREHLCSTVVGVGRSPWGAAEFAEFATEAISSGTDRRSGSFHAAGDNRSLEGLEANQSGWTAKLLSPARGAIADQGTRLAFGRRTEGVRSVA